MSPSDFGDVASGSIDATQDSKAQKLETALEEIASAKWKNFLFLGIMSPVFVSHVAWHDRYDSTGHFDRQQSFPTP